MQETEKNETRTDAGNTLSLDNRKKANLTGVTAVESFNEREVKIRIGETLLTVGGESLNVSKFNTENGTLTVDGKINEIKYSDNLKPAGILKKIFK